MSNRVKTKKREKNLEGLTLKGIGVSGGIAIGRVGIFEPKSFEIARIDIPPDQIDREVERFRSALKRANEDLIKLKEKMVEQIGEDQAAIFDAHLLILNDDTISYGTEDIIRAENVNAEYALKKGVKNFISFFQNTDSEFLKNRISDIYDVQNLIMLNLIGIEEEDKFDYPKDTIIVAKDIAPTQTALMNKDIVSGIITEVGGITSHIAIMARALEIPAVVGVEGATSILSIGDRIILDGDKGIIICNPSQGAVRDYRKRQQEQLLARATMARTRTLPAVTKDGYTIELASNIEFLEELVSVRKYGSDGVGLYRTEFIYMTRPNLPTEEEHFQVYRQLAMETAPKRAIIRTMDIGGDKFVSNLHLPEEINPVMGLRAIRLCLNRPDIFKTQLRAILRASVYGNIHIMFPMISTLWEMISAKEILEEVKDDLRKEGIPFNEKIKVGIMIEVPSAAIIADLLANHCDFFSIGTNDLIQYFLAIDRVNKEVAYLYDPLHPAILRVIKSIIDIGHKKGIWVGLCGEMAGDPLYTQLLLGMGIDELSMNPLSIPIVKQIIRHSSYADARKLAETILAMDDSRKTRVLLEELTYPLLEKIEKT